MSVAEERLPDEVVISARCFEDLVWLCASLEEFAGFGEDDAVGEFLLHANPKLRAAALKELAAGLVESLSRALERAR